MKCISVNDRLPEFDKNVLAYWTIGGVVVVSFSLIEDKICVTDNEHYPILLTGSGFTHWMPLPEPPEEKEI